MLKKIIIASDKKMLFLRLLIATLVLLDLLYAKLYFPESTTDFDLFQLRFIVSLGLTATFIASFFLPPRSKFLQLISGISLLVNTLFELFLLHEHKFHYVNVSELLFTILITSLVLSRVRYIIIYLTFITFSFVYVNYLLGQTTLDILMHAILISMYSIVMFSFATLKLYFENKFKNRGDLVNHLFQDTQECLILADQKTFFIQYLNHTAKEVFTTTEETIYNDIRIDDFFKSKGFEFDLNSISIELNSKGYFFHQIEFVKNNGEYFLGHLYVKLLISDDSSKWFIRISDLSEQFKANTKLQENWDTFSRILDAIPHKIFLKDPESKFLLVNKAVESVHGQNKEFFLGKTDYDLFPTEKALELRDQEIEVMKSEVNHSFHEEKVTMADGSERLFQITKMAFYLPEFKQNGLFGLGIDVTQINNYQEKLRKSEASYRMLMEQASDGIYSADKYGIMTDANPKACQMLGYSKGEIVGTNVKSLTDDKDDRFFNIELLNFKDMRSLILERKFKRKDGSVFIVELSATILDDGGHQGIMRDITERKRMEKILQENEKKFRALIESSHDITVILDDNFKVGFISPSVLKILGFVPKKLEGNTPFDLIHPEEKEITQTFLSNLLLNPKEFKILPEIRMRTFMGIYRYFEVAGNNLMADPAVNGLVINLHDITDRKNTEKQLINTNYELDSFVYRVSHDIKAPLRSVMGLISIAKIENKQSEIATYLEMMNKSVLNLDQFIKDLTLFSRNSRMELDFSRIDFEKTIDSCIEGLKYMDNVDKVKIHKNIKPNIFFYSDVTRINTIIGNLLSNSLKYHKFDANNSFVNISVTEENKNIVITVEDNGVGIKAEYQSKIFDMFYRASEKSYGSGLGLYIVQTAIKKLKGTIEVQSVLNEGTKFIVVLPRLTVTNNNG
jgi:PAS domain S-box-containing protein